MDLVLTDAQAGYVRAAALSVGTGTSSAPWSGARYAVTQYSGGYPLLPAPGTTWLSALVSSSSVWPQVSTHDLPTNHDACRGAVLSLDCSGPATR